MAKKSRRVRTKADAREYTRSRMRTSERPRLSPAQLVQPKAAVPPRNGTSVRMRTSGEMVAPIVVPAEPGTSDLRAEYVYVIRDLRRIGIIAGAMLVLLIALAVALT